MEKTRCQKPVVLAVVPDVSDAEEEIFVQGAVRKTHNGNDKIRADEE